MRTYIHLQCYTHTHTCRKHNLTHKLRYAHGKRRCIRTLKLAHDSQLIPNFVRTLAEAKFVLLLARTVCVCGFCTCVDFAQKNVDFAQKETQTGKAVSQREIKFALNVLGCVPCDSAFKFSVCGYMKDIKIQMQTHFRIHDSGENVDKLGRGGKRDSEHLMTYTSAKIRQLVEIRERERARERGRGRLK